MIDSFDIQAKSDQMNAVDLVAAITSRIAKVDYNPRQEQPIKLFLEGYEKRPYKPCKSMLRGLCQAWGNDETQWAGKLIEIYCDPTVKWAGEATGGIRIAAISGINEPFDFTIQLNKKQRKIERWEVIPEAQEVTRLFVLTHYQHEINEATTIETINQIVKDVGFEFGKESQAELKDAVIKARAKLTSADAPIDQSKPA